METVAINDGTRTKSMKLQMLFVTCSWQTSAVEAFS